MSGCIVKEVGQLIPDTEVTVTSLVVDGQEYGSRDSVLVQS